MSEIPGLPPEDVFWRNHSWWVGTGRAFVALLFANVAGFLATVVIARRLTPNDFGAMILALGTAGVVAAFLDFSFEQAVVHFGAKAEAAGQRSAVSALLRASLVLDLGIGVAVFAVIVALAEPIAEVFGHGQMSPALVRLAALSVAVTTTDGTSGAALLLAGRSELRAWMAGLAGVLRLGAVLLATSLMPTAQDALWAFVVAGFVGSAVLGLVAFLDARRRWRGERSTSVRQISIRRLVVFAFHSSLTDSLIAVRSGIVVALLARRSNPRSVGVYDVALFPLLATALLTSPLRTTAFPEQARLAAQGRQAVLLDGVRSYTRLAFLVGIPSVVAGWFLLPWLIPWLYSAKYTSAVGPARILLVAGMAFLLSAWSKELAPALGRPEIRTRVALAELALTSVLVLMLAGHGATGAAVAVSISSVATAVAWQILVRRMLSDRQSSPGVS